MREYWEFADRREVAFYVVIGLMLIVGLGMLAARYLGGDEVAVEPTATPIPIVQATSASPSADPTPTPTPTPIEATQTPTPTPTPTPLPTTTVERGAGPDRAV